MCRTAQRRQNDERVLQRKLWRYTHRKREWLLGIGARRLRMAVESRKDIVWCRCDRCKNGTYRMLQQRQVEREIVDYFKGVG